MKINVQKQGAWLSNSWLLWLKATTLLDIYTNSMKFIPTSELCQKSYNKQNLYKYSHSIFNKFVQILLFWQAPMGEFKRPTCCVIDFDKDAAWMQLIRECRSIFSWITILFNQGLASKPFNYPWVVNNLMDLVSDHLKVTFFPDN